MDQNNNPDSTELSITDILQAHDILISMLLGQSLATSRNPGETIKQIEAMVDMQAVSDTVKSHIKHLLLPLKEAITH